jgi:hypothetical protein
VIGILGRLPAFMPTMVPSASHGNLSSSGRLRHYRQQATVQIDHVVQAGYSELGGA